MAIIGKRRKPTVGSVSDKMKGLTLSDVIVPSLFLMILILLTLFVYIPSIKDASNMRGQMKTIADRQAVLDKNLENLQPMINDPLSLQQDVKTVKRIIPKQLEVADFSFFVDQLAQEVGLKFKEISQTNTNRNQRGSRDVADNRNVSSFVSGVTGPIVYEGTYAQIVRFLDQLQRESPYIIEASQLELNRQSSQDDEQSSDLWQIELIITGYYIPNDATVQLADIYSPINVYTQQSDLMNIFNFKHDILEEADR